MPKKIPINPIITELIIWPTPHMVVYFRVLAILQSLAFPKATKDKKRGQE